MFACLPLFYGALSLGYGADTLAEKVKRRAIYAVAVVTAGLPLAITAGQISLWALQLGMALGAGLVLGIKNDLTASQEEMSICLCSTMFFVFYV